MKRLVILCLAVAGAAIYLSTQLERKSDLFGDNIPVAKKIQSYEMKSSMQDNYGQIPMHFEPNLGQAAGEVDFVSRGQGYVLHLSRKEAVLNLRQGKDKRHRPETDWRSAVAEMSPDAGPSGKGQHQSKPGNREVSDQTVLKMKLLNSNSGTRGKGFDELPGRSNYFFGDDPDKFLTNVANFAKVRYEEVYPGVDLVYYGNQRALEFDFVVRPGADPGVITLDFEGTNEIHIDEDGNLILKTNGGEVAIKTPAIYQVYDDHKQMIAGSFVKKKASNQIGFELTAYDPGLALVIDPIVVYSTYLGGTESEYGLAVAVDTAGSAYVAGWTESNDFPTFSPLYGEFAGKIDGFVAKLSPDGSSLLYSTYFGGSEDDLAWGIAVDLDSNVYITGHTLSGDFPTANAFQDGLGGGADAFVAKLNAKGDALVYSTYLGGTGTDNGNKIAIDDAGSAYVTGSTFSNDFPLANPFQNSRGFLTDAFVTKLSPDGSSLIYSTYLAGNSSTSGLAIAVDDAGSAYVSGFTFADDFPTANALQGSRGGSGDVFVTKMSPNGSSLVYSTYIGGSESDSGFGIDVDTAGCAYIVGNTRSEDFPIANAYQDILLGSQDAFVTKLSPDGSVLIFSTYFGGAASEAAYAVALDSSGNANFTGETSSDDFPTINAFQDTRGGSTDAFLTSMSYDGTALYYSSYLGGGSSDRGEWVALDTAGNALVTGWTRSNDFLIESPLQDTRAGIEDVFITRIVNVDSIEITAIHPSPFDFWPEGVFRPGQEVELAFDVFYDLASAASGMIVITICNEFGVVLEEEIMDPVPGGLDIQLLDLQTDLFIIPEGMDSLFIAIELIPDNVLEASAVDELFFPVFIHEWTFMVYLDGDNDLEFNSLIDFFEMFDIGSNDSVAIVLQWDRHPRGDLEWGYFDGYFREGFADWSQTRRMFLHEGYLKSENMGELNMGDPNTLYKFVRWGMDTFPAKHYALVLWDHGGGWRSPALTPPAFAKSQFEPKLPESSPMASGGRRGRYKDVVVDETDNDRLYSSEIQSALNRLPNLDILGFDACLMGMVENAYQYRFGATYMVASEALEPLDGWPYDLILDALKKQPTMSPRVLSQTIVQTYGESYPPHDLDITQAAVDLRWMDEIRQSLDLLAGQLIEKRPWGDVEAVLDDLKFFWPEPNRDLYHFAQLLKNESQDEEVRSACDALMQSLFNGVIDNYHSTAEENANGLAIFFPRVWAQYDASYDWVNNIELSDDSQWDEFLRLFLSRRAPDRVLDTYEVNDTFTQAYGPLHPETAYQSYIPVPEDEDFYFISTGLETDLWVKLTSPSVNYDLAVYDFNGTLLASSLLQDDVDSVHLADLSPDAYYIEVISNGLFLQQLPYELEVNYTGSKKGRVPLSSDDGMPDSSLYSTTVNDVIGATIHAPDYPMVLDEISYFIESIDGAGSGGDGSFSVWLADYYGTIVDPFTVTPSGSSFGKGQQQGSWFTVDLTGQDIRLQSDFFVGIAYDGQNTPALGIDTLSDGRTYQWDATGGAWHSLSAAAFVRAKVSYLEALERIRIALPSDLQGAPGETVVVPVEIGNISSPGADSVRMDLRYDASILHFGGFTLENTLTAGWQFYRFNSQNTGRVEVELRGETPLTGPGILLTLQFEISPSAANGDSSEVLLEDFVLDEGTYAVETEPGLITVAFTTPVEADVSTGVPLEFRLSQNYPNPFNPATRISYAIAKRTHVRIEIFNLLGQKIKTLVDEQQPAGSNEVMWDGTLEDGSLANSGVYIFRMKTDGFEDIGKLTLLR